MSVNSFFLSPRHNVDKALEKISALRVFSLVFLSYVLIYFIWGDVTLKVLALPIAVCIFLSKRYDLVFSLFVGMFCVLTYFVIHGYSGAHDLKSILIILHFVVPASICYYATRPLRADIRVYAYFAASFIALNLLFNEQTFVLNAFDDSGVRYRGFVLVPLVVLLVAVYRGGVAGFFFLSVVGTIFVFLISGHRGSAIIVFGSLMLVWAYRCTSKVWCLYLIPVLHASYPLGVLIYEILFPNEINNIIVRALSVKIILEDLNFFGHGMALPVLDFHQTRDFGHYFVPADVMYLGGIYEVGYLFYVIKSIFIFFIAKNFWRNSNKAVITLVCSFALFGYNFTYDAFEFVASAAIFMFLSRVR